MDEAALIKALDEGWIRGAGLDVFEQEPTSPDNPLLKMENVIVTSHCLAHTDQMLMGKWEENVKQISELVRGEVPDSLVNRDVLDNPKFQSKLKKFREDIGCS